MMDTWWIVAFLPSVLRKSVAYCLRLFYITVSCNNSIKLCIASVSHYVNPYSAEFLKIY